MTVDALAALPQRQRDDIIASARRMTAQDFLRQIEFYDARLTMPCVRKLLAYRFDRVLYREVVLDYRRRLRTKWTLRRQRLNPSCPPSTR
jgi:hypothetical protein